MGLVVGRIEIAGSQVSVETEPFRLDLGTPAVVSAYVAALDIAEFLNLESPGGLKDFAISIRGGKLFVEATARVIVEVRAKAVCTLRIHEGQALYIDLESVDVMGLGAKNMVQGHLDQINPILDAKDLPVAMSLESVEADHDLILLKGVVSSLRLG